MIIEIVVSAAVVLTWAFLTHRAWKRDNRIYTKADYLYNKDTDSWKLKE